MKCGIKQEKLSKYADYTMLQEGIRKNAMFLKKYYEKFV